MKRKALPGLSSLLVAVVPLISSLSMIRNALVVIELKVARGYDRAAGQLLRYMAWIEKDLAEPGQAVRGIIAARKISDDLRLACSYLSARVSLYEYELSVTLRKVPSGDLNG